MNYFAYGSNMNYEQMRRLCGWHFTVVGPARLTDYEFGPDVRGNATIRQKPGAKVVGVLYDLDQHALDVLDEFEGTPLVFHRSEVEVEIIGEAGKNMTAWVYLEDASQFGGSYIKEDYLKRVIAGAADNRLPQDWIDFLNSFKKIIKAE